MTTHSVDDLLVKDMQNQQAPVQAISNPAAPESAPENVTRGTLENTETQDLTNNETATPPQDSALNSENTQSSQQTSETKPSSVTDKPNSASNIDEYGNPIEKPRVYTEEEVQRMFIDSRLALKQQKMTQPQQPMSPQAQEAAKDFKADPNSEESWEIQLNNFIDKRLETRQVELQQREWQQQEAQKQADFEAKFNVGMNKYQDFEQVVTRVASSITPSMMLAARSLNDPAAFIYGASKLHPAELERISKINDSYVQAAEVGRLHERMVKHRGVVSSAPKPIESPKGDIPNKPINTDRSLDQRINDYAKQKRR